MVGTGTAVRVAQNARRAQILHFTLLFQPRVGYNSSRCGAGWLEDWLVVGRACSLGGSVGYGRVRKTSWV